MLALSTRLFGGGGAQGNFRQILIMAKKNYYAVVRGKQPGLYKTWEECSKQVQKFPGNIYQGFQSENEALSFLRQNGVPVGSESLVSTALHPAKKPRRQVAQGKPSSLKDHAAMSSIQRIGDGTAPEQSKQPFTTRKVSMNADHVLRIEFDGASKGNPGKAGFGAVLYNHETNAEVARLCQYMGSTHTNNQAEYAGLIAGLKAAVELGCNHVYIRGDSKLIIYQILGLYSVKNEGLRPYHAAALSLLHHFESFEAHQVPRGQNKVADALSNEAITNYFSGINPDIWSLASCMEGVPVTMNQVEATEVVVQEVEGAAKNKPKRGRKRKTAEEL